MILKFKEKLWTTQNINDENYFNPKFFFLGKTMCFYLKWCIKKKNTKQNTKIQLKKTVYETVNLAQQKLTNKKENSRNTKNDITFS